MKIMQTHLIKSVMEPCLLLLGIPQFSIVQQSPIGQYGHIRQQVKTQEKIQNSQFIMNIELELM
jgi:hypothetical protein